ncbi:helix-turn-helix domain-containing protein [Nonomuraea sp. NPDC050790]|uniref:helix-turn-helix domain-containing protein n=1 Tax=Nonomuraea sp. NPDC050790 TaxID=3364371 RepID=UPI00378A4C89
MGRVSNIVRHQLLAAELRRLRVEIGLSGPSVAKALGWSPAKFSRIESALVRPSRSDMLILLDHYGVVEPARAGLLLLANQAAQRNWWDAHAKALPGGYLEYIGLEFEAARVTNWEGLVLPGLLQTDELVGAINSAGEDFFAVPPSAVRVRNQVRLTRQKLLTDPDPLDFTAVIDEVVLHRTVSLLRDVGGAEAARRQFAHLIEMAQRDNVTVHVIELWKTYPLVATSSLIRMAFEPVEEAAGLVHPDVAYMESVAGGSLAYDEEEVYQFDRLLKYLVNKSLNPEDSLRLIHRVAGEIED